MDPKLSPAVGNFGDSIAILAKNRKIPEAISALENGFLDFFFFCDILILSFVVCEMDILLRKMVSLYGIDVFLRPSSQINWSNMHGNSKQTGYCYYNYYYFFLDGLVRLLFVFDGIKMASF